MKDQETGRSLLGNELLGLVRSARAVAQELEDKVCHYPNRSGASIGRRLFARRLPAGTAADGNTTWHDLRDLYR